MLNSRYVVLEYTFIFYGMIVNAYLIEICGVSHYMYYYN